MDAVFIKALERIVGPEQVVTNRAGRKVYSYDASLVEGLPGMVAFPGNTSEVSAIVALAETHGVNYIPRGFGTNLSGGTITVAGGLVISLARFNRILDVQIDHRRAIVQPGVPNLDLQNRLADVGFFYAPDPASQKVATLGGNAAENSGGPRCLKYGVTTNHILEMEVVLPGGRIVRLGGPNGDGPGPDLRGFFIGSEGTLGIVTEIVVRILPLPQAVITMLAVYDSLADAARTVSAVIAEGMVPAALEMMDQPVMQAVEASVPCGYPLDAAAVLIVEVEGPKAGLENQAVRIQDICRKYGCREIRRAHNDQERNALWAGRRGAFGAVARLAPRYLVADSTVPRTKLPEALAQVVHIVKEYGLDCGNVFHAGDGNLHPLIFFDPKEPGQYEKVHQAGWDVMVMCARLGGTITGEHGVGLEKREGMRLVFSEETLALMRDLKSAVDPGNRLNPGKIVPDDIHVPAPAISTESPTFSVETLVPENEAMASEMVRWAAGFGRRLCLAGGGRRTKDLPLSGSPLVSLVSSRLNQIHEYDPGNQVVTAGSGLTIGALQDILAENGQWLPLRPPLDQDSTLGGLAALGCSGPERLSYGAFRDLALGLRFISGQGRVINAGGKVVKNVAGYDLTRLLVGSAGRLGFITEVTLKVQQRPTVRRSISGEGDLGACRQAAQDLLKSNTCPAFITVQPEPGGGWSLHTGYEGMAPTVEDGLKRTGERYSRCGLSNSKVDDYPLEAGPWTPIYRRIYQCPFVIRIDLPLGRVPGVLASFPSLIQPSRLLWDAGSGRLLAGLDQFPMDIWPILARETTKNGGYMLLEKAPDPLEPPPSGDLPAVWPLLTRMKQAMDPNGVFPPFGWLGSR